MTVDFLSAPELERLTELLFTGSEQFQAIMKKFLATFSKESYAQVAVSLKLLCRQLTMSASLDFVAVIVSMFLLDVLRKGECQEAKTSFYDVLAHLEQTLRKEVRRIEQNKYTSNTKDGSKSNRCVVEMMEAEVFRMHCTAKLFGLQLLGNASDAKLTANSILSLSQDQIEPLLDEWEKNNVQLKEMLADLSHAWGADAQQSCVDVLGQNATVACPFTTSSRALLSLQCTHPRLPLFALYPGEAHFLLPATSLGSLMLFDGKEHTEAWKTAMQLVEEGCKGPLSAADQSKLILSLSVGSMVHCMGFERNTVSQLAVNNPEVGASIIVKLPLPVAQSCVEKILSSPISIENMETILLNTTKVLQQYHVRKYISSRLQSLSAESATPLSTQEGKEALKNFMNTLYQLVKAGKENKELYVSDVQRMEVGKVCEACGIPEVVTKWEQVREGV